MTQATGIVVIRRRKLANRMYPYYNLVLSREYKSVQERKEIMKKLIKNLNVDNRLIVISVIPKI